MSRWLATLWLIAAVVYFIVPWDLDFIPFVGRLDDLFFLALAGYYFWKQPKAPGGDARRRRPTAGNAPADPERPGARSDADSYNLFGVSESDDVETIKRAYRDLIAKYHPDRVQHLGEEFREMAAVKTSAINNAYERIKKARGFS